MANKNMNDILNEIAKASQSIGNKADVINKQACPNCGAPIEQPMSDQGQDVNRADTDYPSSSGNQSGSSEDK